MPATAADLAVPPRRLELLRGGLVVADVDGVEGLARVPEARGAEVEREVDADVLARRRERVEARDEPSPALDGRREFGLEERVDLVFVERRRRRGRG